MSIYGWVRWRQARAGGGQIVPRWASGRARVGIVVTMLVGTVALTPLFRQLGSYEPVWADAWTFVGSLLATYGMARGWVEFWLIWIAVDVVGVPLLLVAGYYPSAIMYIVYGGFCVVGFITWLRIERRERTDALAEGVDTPVVETVG